MLHDTICAVSTPAGVGGIAVVRVSGPQAIAITQKIWRGKPLDAAASHTAHLGTITDSDSSPLDQAVAIVFRAPASFTGEDIVELSVHGSRYVQQRLVHALIDSGARLAEAGEFTRRAFAAGKMDLAQAEAVADVIASDSRAAHRIALGQMRGRFSSRLRSLRDQLLDLSSLLELELDFSEEDVEFASRQQLLDIALAVQAEVGRLADSFDTASVIKDGIPVAIIGATNAGKSSLLNALLGDDRAIVSDIHGTTRDIVEDTLAIGDYTFRLMDTAGLRDTSDTVEAMGIERSRAAATRARIVIAVIDRTCPVIPDLSGVTAPVILAVNKADLAAPALPIEPTALAATPSSAPALPGQVPFLSATPSCTPALPIDPSDYAAVIDISALRGDGLDTLRHALEQTARAAEGDTASVLVTNARHYEALVQARESISRAIDAMRSGLSGDLIALDTRLTIHHLSSILGDISSQDVLNNIFSRFCIGK